VGFNSSNISARRPSASKIVSSHLPPLIKLYPSFSFCQSPKIIPFYNQINRGKYGTALEQIQIVLKIMKIEWVEEENDICEKAVLSLTTM
jgi:hypothetical protein